MRRGASSRRTGSSGSKATAAAAKESGLVLSCLAWEVVDVLLSAVFALASLGRSYRCYPQRNDVTMMMMMMMIRLIERVRQAAFRDGAELVGRARA